MADSLCVHNFITTLCLQTAQSGPTQQKTVATIKCECLAANPGASMKGSYYEHENPADSLLAFIEDATLSVWSK